MLDPLLLLAHHLVLDLLLRAHLLLDELALLLLARLDLLTLDYLLERRVLHVLLVPHDLHEVTLLPLLQLHALHLATHLVLQVPPGHVHVLLVLLLGRTVLSLTELLFMILLSLPLDAFLLYLDVSLACDEYVVGAFLGLVELLPRLLLLLLEQRDPIRQQLVVLLGPLPRHLRRDQLPMQRLVVVVLVHVQIHLVRRREMAPVQLIIQVLVVILLILLMLRIVLWRIDIIYVLFFMGLFLVMSPVFLVITTTSFRFLLRLELMMQQSQSPSHKNLNLKTSLTCI